MAIAAATSSPTMSLSLSHSHSHSLDDIDTSTTANTKENNYNYKNINGEDEDDDDGHEQDVVMPGFRFHPTEEELVEFYLRRKVEGKPFNVELITFLDLYRYDPWELPGLAAIGEKEWYFYVPRDRKYRNGDRPNRVTTSGYWKATGADRMIRTESFRSIGLKKTLVFYSGKAPKGIRTSWIMNEYRLPHHETERFQKAEISLCRVYKRSGVEDHHSLPRCLPTSSRPSHHKNKHNLNQMVHHHNMGFLGQSPTDQIVDNNKMNYEAEGSRSVATTNHANNNNYRLGESVAMEDDEALMLMHQSQQAAQAVASEAAPFSFFPTGSSSNSSSLPCISNNNAIMMDDHHNRLESYNHQQSSQYYYNNINAPPPPPQSHQYHHLPNLQFSNLLLHPQQQPMMPLNSLPTSFSDRLWDWNPIPDATNRDFTNMSFK